MTICKDLGKKEYYEYSKQLKKLERTVDQRAGMGGYDNQYDMGGNQMNMGGMGGYDNGPQQDYNQPIETPAQEKRYVQQRDVNEDENWGDEDDVNELLPS